MTLTGGVHRATFLPALGMLGASFLWRGKEFLSLHGGLDGWRAGRTTAMPLLAPWANRLGSSRFTLGSEQVDLSLAASVHRDENGLPIHGLVLGEHLWSVDGIEDAEDRGRLAASFAFDEHPLLLRSFPFPHRLEVVVEVDATGLAVETAVCPTGDSAVPVSFGWHPYFRLPGVARRDLVIDLPPREHVGLDDRQIPTGHTTHQPRRSVSLRGRFFDDGYRLGRQRRFTLAGDDTMLIVEFDEGFPYAQVYAPRGKAFVAIEPMVAPTNALISGDAPWVGPGERFAARFQVRVEESPNGDQHD